MNIDAMRATKTAHPRHPVLIHSTLWWHIETEFSQRINWARKQNEPNLSVPRRMICSMRKDLLAIHLAATLTSRRL